MFNKKTIFFFERLNLFNLLLIFILKFFFLKKNFFYRNREVKFNNSFLLKIIGILNLKHLNYMKAGHNNFIKGLITENVKLTDSILLNIRRDKNYSKILKYYNFKKNTKEMFDIYLSKLLAGNHLQEGVSSIKLLNYTFKNYTKILYFPENLGNFLLCKHQSNTNIKPIIFLIFLKTLIRIFLHAFSFKNYIFKKNLKPKVLFCPHRGLKYGNAFNKNFIFKKLQFKKFHNDEILVADHNHDAGANPNDEITKRYYKRFKINEVKFLDFNKYNYFNIFNFIFKVFKFNYSNILYSCFLIYAFNDLQNCIKFLKRYKNLRVAIFSYDILANSTFVLACKILNIRTFSYQDRTNAYSYWPYMYFDEYYISGPRMKKMFSENFYKFEKINIMPLSRASLIKKDSIEDKKNIICLPPPILSELNRSNFGNILSDDDRSQFYDIVLNLAESFPDFSFLIKEKFKRNNSIVTEFYKKIEKLQIKNILMLDNTKKNSLYNIINHSELIFGTYTSFLDECFSVKKPLILYDKDFVAFDKHPLIHTNLYCKNLLDIKKSIKTILLKKNLDDKKTQEIRNDYFPSLKHTSENVYFDIIKKINSIII